MQKFIFVCKQHEEYGSLGWALKRKPHFEPFPGMTVAHDIMEHFPRDKGLLSDEWQAFGAMLYIRGHGNWWGNQGNRNPFYGDQAYVDVLDHYRKVSNEELSLHAAPKSQELDEEEEIQLKLLVKNFKDALADEYNENPYDLDLFCTSLLGWIRFGYRRAIKRYGNTSSYMLCDMFTEIANEADRILKDAYEGFEMEIILDIENAEVKVIQREEYSYN